jgi:hypothetical protein
VFDAIGSGSQRASEVGRRQQHVALRGGMQPDRMSFIEHSSDNRGGLVGDVLIDQEKRRVNLLTS